MREAGVFEEAQFLSQLGRLYALYDSQLFSKDKRTRFNARVNLQNVLYLKEIYFGGGIRTDELSGFLSNLNHCSDRLCARVD